MNCRTSSQNPRPPEKSLHNGKIQAKTFPTPVRMPVMCFRSCPALSGAPICWTRPAENRQAVQSVWATQASVLEELKPRKPAIIRPG